jgi:hypothetical protein
VSVDTVHPALKRQDGEPAGQHAALLEFASMGLGRRRTELARRHGIAHQTINKWEKRWAWKTRLDAYDQDVAQSKAFNATSIRTSAVEFCVRVTPKHVKNLDRLAEGGPSVPASVQFNAIVQILRIAGLITDAKPDTVGVASIVTNYTIPARPNTDG